MSDRSKTAALRARTRHLLLLKQRGRCCWCGCTMRTKGDPNHPEFATIEHLIPRAHGGPNERGNLAMACRRCNNERGAPEPVTTSGPKQDGGGAMAAALGRAGLVPA